MKTFVKISIPILVVAFISVTFLLAQSPDVSRQISLKNGSLFKTINDEFNVVDACGVTFHFVENPEPNFTSSNSEVVEVDVNSGNAKCLKNGIATISIIVNSEIGLCQKNVTVIVEKPIVYSEYAYFDFPEITVFSGASSTNMLNIQKCSFTPTISYKNGSATYNYLTGEVTATADDTVYVTIPKNDEELFLIKFEVKVEQRELIQIEKEYTINTTSKIDYQSQIQSVQENSVFTVNANTNQECVSILTESFGYIIIETHKQGQSLITLSNEKYVIKIFVTVI